MTYKESSIDRFQRIGNSIGEHKHFSSKHSLLLEGDSLELIKKFPDKSVDLILTDPPYHSTKKKNIFGDTSFAEDKHYLEWMNEYFREWRRILKDNGSIYCFCSLKLAGRLENILWEKFNVLSVITWIKPNDPGFDGWKQKMNKGILRTWYPHSEKILFAEPAAEGNLKRSTLGHKLKELRQLAGMTAHKLAEITKAYGKVNHGGAISNWEAGRNVPSREQWQKITDALLDANPNIEVPRYEDAVRPFNYNGSDDFTDFWNFSNIRPYKGKHPAEKPLDMLEHVIETSSYEGAVVLDCFSGSGATAVASLLQKRLSVSIEIDDRWLEVSANRIQMAEDRWGKSESTNPSEIRLAKVSESLSLF